VMARTDGGIGIIDITICLAAKLIP
jgi:hypothetical protein